MLVFSVETSCDETSVCIMQEDKSILSHIVYSQEIHKKHGGVVPELASRAHLEILQNITKEALKESGVKLNEINLFSATCGPGLIGGLLIGSTFTKSLSIGNGKPFIPINHLEAHILSSFYNNEIKFPHIILLITGGHTQIYFLRNYNDIILIGGGYIFNAHDIWKHYIDIGLDKIKKISKPNKMEYINYTPKSI